MKRYRHRLARLKPKDDRRVCLGEMRCEVNGVDLLIGVLHSLTTRERRRARASRRNESRMRRLYDPPGGYEITGRNFAGHEDALRALAGQT